MNADGTIILETRVDTKGVDEGLNEIEDIVDKENPGIDLKVNEQSKGLKAISRFAKSIASKFLGISRATISFLGSIAKIVAKLGIIGGLLGIIALAGLGIVSSFNKAIEKDKELETQLKYLKFVMQSAFDGIGEALVKVVKWIINVLFKTIVAIGGIIKAITGKNIFKKSGIKDFEKSMKSADKSAKSLQKTLAGWDEAEVLGGNGNLADGLLGDLSKLPKIADEVDKFSDKFKKWFTGGYDNFFVGLYEEAKLVPQRLIQILSPIYNLVLKPYIIDPFINSMKFMWDSIEPYVKPIWNRLKLEWGKIVAQFRPIWDSFINYLQPIKETIAEKLKPIKDAWNDVIENYMKPIWQNFYNSLPTPFKDALDKIWIKFKTWYNDIAFYLNNIGIKVGYITDTTETEAINAGKAVKKEVGEVSKGIDNISSKTINIKTNTSQVSKLKTTLDDIVANMIYLTGGTITTTWTTSPAKKKEAKGAIIYPKLAVGGIVNMPGRGIPYRGATIGERGAEGIIPLTDSQQMALLGEAIGKFVTINATIPVYAYNREVDRQIQKIKANENFASNK